MELGLRLRAGLIVTLHEAGVTTAAEKLRVFA